MREDLLPVKLEDCISHLVEECGEVLQAIGKLQRFGEKATDSKTGITYNNIGKLLEELNDLDHAIGAVVDSLVKK